MGSKNFQGFKRTISCVSSGGRGKNCVATKWVEILFGKPETFGTTLQYMIWLLYKHCTKKNVFKPTSSTIL